jgi:hypothetical protein
MARTVTLSDARSAVLRLGGVDVSADLTSTVLNEAINAGIAELHDLLLEKADDRLVTSTTLTTSIGVESVALPTTFYELRKLEIVDGSTPSGYRKLYQGSLDSSHLYTTVVGKRYRYRLQGSNLVLMPTPQAIESLRLFYIPYATVLTADADLIDGYNGYEDLIYHLAWRRCLVRQDLATIDIGRDMEPFYLLDRVSYDEEDLG